MSLIQKKEKENTVNCFKDRRRSGFTVFLFFFFPRLLWTRGAKHVKGGIFINEMWCFPRTRVHERIFCVSVCVCVLCLMEDRRTEEGPRFPLHQGWWTEETSAPRFFCLYASSSYFISLRLYGSSVLNKGIYGVAFHRCGDRAETHKKKKKIPPPWVYLVGTFGESSSGGAGSWEQLRQKQSKSSPKGSGSRTSCGGGGEKVTRSSHSSSVRSLLVRRASPVLLLATTFLPFLLFSSKVVNVRKCS